MPLVDILLATWNGTMFIEELIESLAAQTTAPHRLVVADDGSTDDTVARIEQTAHRLGIEVVLAHRTSVGGAAANFGRLLAHAAQSDAADYFAFADQDDRWHPTKLERSIGAISHVAWDRPAAVFHDARVVGADGTHRHESHLAFRGLPPRIPTIPQLLMQNPASGNTLLFNRAVLDRATPMPASAPMHDWWIALHAASYGELVGLNEVLVDYRQHDANERGAAGIGLERIMSEAKQAIGAFSRDRVSDRFDLAGAFVEAHPLELTHPAHALHKLRGLPLGQRQVALLRGGFLHAGIARNLAMLALV